MTKRIANPNYLTLCNSQNIFEKNHPRIALLNVLISKTTNLRPTFRLAISCCSLYFPSQI